MAFCFKCGKDPTYQLELKHKHNGKIQGGPFWPMCYDCMCSVSWGDILHNTVIGIESLYEEKDGG